MPERSKPTPTRNRALFGGGTLLALAFLLAVLPVCAQDTPPIELQVKAAMIFNFVHFVEWPAGTYASADAPILIAVVGGGSYAAAIEQAVSGKTVGGRTLSVKRFATVDAAEAPQVLVCAGGDCDIGRFIGKSVLTIGDTEPFMRAGGTIRFYTEANRVRFEVSPEAAEKSSLKISSKLLKLARIYRK